MAVAATSYIFLDVDGVLLPFGEGVGDSHQFPRRCLDALAHIITACAPEVVLSSTWRCDPHAMAMMREQFRAYGEPLASLTLDVCTDLAMHSERQWEIAAWLQAASARGLDVRRFVVLDDMECVDGKANRRFRDMFWGRCILVPSALGLRPMDAEKAIAILRH
ncbi:hypothetical protein KFE25_006358 [Diacronema lutheri]|uniref:Uncharacterized protein n=1 Tax=Diacronema lutheri TaxID=2081491 RepID=A0A8J5XQN8_DIALT|nr:hypothetical protein KFE25_006358 [Diacronema lutheri]